MKRDPFVHDSIELYSVFYGNELHRYNINSGGQSQWINRVEDNI